jgi:TolA-binding protein
VKDHVAESLIKFADCLRQLQKKKEACVTLSQVQKDFKDLPRNIQVLEKSVQDTLKCPKS